MLDKLMFLFLHKKLSSYFPSLLYILLPTSIMDLLKLHIPDTGDTAFLLFNSNLGLEHPPYVLICIPSAS